MALSVVPYSVVLAFVGKESRKNKDVARVVRHLAADTAQLELEKAIDPNSKSTQLLTDAVNNYTKGLDLLNREVTNQMMPVMARAGVSVEKSTLAGLGQVASLIPVWAQTLLAFLPAIGVAFGLAAYKWDWFAKGNASQNEYISLMKAKIKSLGSAGDISAAAAEQNNLAEYLKAKEPPSNWMTYLTIGVVGYFALFHLPGIVKDWSGAAGSVKQLKDKDEAPGRAPRASLPAPGYGYPAQQQQAPQNGGGYGPPPAPMPTPKKRPKTPPAAFKNRMKTSKKAKAGDSRYNGL